MENPKEIARVLMFEFGLAGALKYAKRKAAQDHLFAIAYHESIPFIEAAIDRRNGLNDCTCRVDADEPSQHCPIHQGA